MTYRKYFELLAAHDWLFDFSDDTRIYTAGKNDQDCLQVLADTAKSSTPRAMLTAWRLHIFSGPAYGTAPLPKPKLSDFRVS